MGLLSSGTPVRPIDRSRGVTPSSGTVYRGPGMCVFEARSLIAFHPLGTNHQASCSLFSLAEIVSRAQARSLLRVITRNVILFLRR